MRESSGITRAAIGLAQGFALYFLYQAFDAKTWPATDGLVFAPLVLVGVIVGVQTFNAQSQQALVLQHQIASRESSQVSDFFQGVQNQLQTVAREREFSVASTMNSWRSLSSAWLRSA